MIEDFAKKKLQLTFISALNKNKENNKNER